MWGKELTSRKWRSRKIGATTPPPNRVGFWGSRKNSATTPPPTESRRLLGTPEQFCYYPPPPPNRVGFWRSRKRLKKLNNLNLAALRYLDTCPNQFGFKRNHGTDQCIYVLKEIIDSYRVMNGSVFTCFLDASKAFDRVNHRILFTKLGNRGTPQYIIRILSFWYANQQMCIRWGGTYIPLPSVYLMASGKAAFSRLIYSIFILMILV